MTKLTRTVRVWRRVPGLLRKVVIAAGVAAACTEGWANGPFVQNVGGCTVTVRLEEACNQSYFKTLAPGEVHDAGISWNNRCGCCFLYSLKVFDLSGRLLGEIPSVQLDPQHNTTQTIRVAGCQGTPPPIEDKKDIGPSQVC